MASALGTPAGASRFPTHPYPGLRPFEQEERRIFRGRDNQITDIVERLRRTHFAVLVGGSGTGKSSVIRAGVIPELWKKRISERGDFWLIAAFTPQDRPFENLAQVLAELIDPEPETSQAKIVEEVEDTLLETNSLAGFLERYRNCLRLEEDQAPESRQSANLLVLCDQFEEVFRDENRFNPQTRQLVDLIVEAHENGTKYPRLYVIIGMRSEDLHRCAAFIDLPNVINAAGYLTRRLNDKEVAAAIIEPIRICLQLRDIQPDSVGPIDEDPWPFDVKVLRRLYDEVKAMAHDPDHLPLLQHLLSVLWRRVEPRVRVLTPETDPAVIRDWRITEDDLTGALRFSDVAETRTFQGSLLKRALDNEATAALPKETRQRKIAERMFRLLAEVDDRGNYKRRWTTRNEIAAVAGERIEDIEPVIEKFAAPYPFLYARPGPEAKIDVAHEAFIRNWTQFRDWLEDERKLAIAYVRLRREYLGWRERATRPAGTQSGTARIAARSQAAPHGVMERWGGVGKRLEDARHWVERVTHPARTQITRFFTRRFGGLSWGTVRELRDWWKRRGSNLAWSSRYAKGVDAASDARARREAQRQNQEMLPKLRRFYRWTVWRNRAAVSIVLGVFFGLSGTALYLFNLQRTSDLQAGREREERELSQLEAASYRPFLLAGAVINGIGQGMDGVTEARERAYEAAVALELLPTFEKEMMTKKGDLRSYYLASRQADNAARLTLANLLWQPMQQGAPTRRETPGLDLPAACRDKQRAGGPQQPPEQASLLAHTLAPFEPEGGIHLFAAANIVKQLDETGQEQRAKSVNFLSVNQSCDFRLLGSLGIPLPGDISVDLDLDPALRVVVANIKSAGKYKETWMYRIRWIRRCEAVDPQSKRCSAEGLNFSPDVDGPVRYPNGPYKAVNATHVEAVDKDTGKSRGYYGIRWEYKPVPLFDEKERSAASGSFEKAARVKASEQPGKGTVKLMCDKSGHHAVIVKTEFREFQGKKQPPSNELTIVRSDRNAETCADYLNERRVVSKTNLPHYTIERVAFSRDNAAEAVPDHVYIGSVEPDVIYRFAWKPGAMREMLCESLRHQYAGKIPPPTDAVKSSASFSPELKDWLQKQDTYTPTEICKSRAAQ
jgi:hypothetical protein